MPNVAGNRKRQQDRTRVNGYGPAEVSKIDLLNSLRLEYSREFVPLAKMFFHEEAYGRTISGRAAIMASNWCPAACPDIIVGIRKDKDGDITYCVIDGCHRVTALRLLGITNAWARVYQTFSPEKESILFDVLNTLRFPVHRLVSFDAARFAGEYYCSKVAKMCAKEGLVIKSRTTTAADITCPQTMVSILSEENGEERLAWILYMIKACWPDRQRDRFSSAMIRAFDSLYTDPRFKGKFSDKDMVSSLTRVTCLALSAYARQLQIATRKTPMWQGLKAAIVGTYNRARTKRRLPPLFG